MKKKQVLALLLSVALMTSGLSACGLPSGSGADSQAENPPAGAVGTEEELEAAIGRVIGDGEAGSATKEETVYVFADANGNTKHVTVSNWLKNRDGSTRLTDHTTLTDIENVKGEESFTTGSGDELTWDADGNDIYYQGSTTKQPPVSARITYSLDGNEISPAELSGKSGNVKIRIDSTNSEKKGDVYVPFTALTGMVFSNDHVRNVKVDHGSIVSEGKNTVVVGMGFPGLQDSLEPVKERTEEILSENEDGQEAKNRLADLEIPSTVEITMDATDFAMSTCLTMVMSGLGSAESGDRDQLEEDRKTAIERLDERVKELTEDGNALADGAEKLSSGIGEADDAMPDLTDGTGALADGIKEYTDGVSKVNRGAGQLSDGTDEAEKGAKKLSKGIDDDTDGAGKLSRGAESLSRGIKGYTDGAGKLRKGADTLSEGAAKLDANSSALKTGSKALLDGISDEEKGLKAGVKNYTDGVGQIDDGLQKLNGSVSGDGTKKNPGLASGAQQLQKGISDYTAGAAKADAGAAKLAADGAAPALAAGTASLRDGLDQYTAGVGQLAAGVEQLTNEESGAPRLAAGAKAVADGAGQIA